MSLKVKLVDHPCFSPQVIDLLSSNYIAVAQMANLMAEWLILAGAEIQTVQQLVENHLHDMILKTFDPKKADAIFAEEGETPSWLAELIEYPTWRSLIYRLAEEYPDCLMLNFTIKLISDAGFQGEITSISTAAQQIEVFSRILKTSVTTYLTSTPETMTKNLSECSSMVCHGQHTYVYAQVILPVAIECGGGKYKALCSLFMSLANASCCRFFSQFLPQKLGVAMSSGIIV